MTETRPVPEISASEARRAGDTRHLISASATVTGLGLVTKALGLVRGPVEAAVFGATRAMDAFNIARQIPQAFSTWLEAPIRAAIVPAFSKRLHGEGEAEAWRAASNVINCLAIFLLGFCGLLFLASKPIVMALGAGFEDPAAWDQAWRIAQILVPSIFFSVLAVILGSLQNIYRRQLYPALGRVLNAICLLGAALWLGPRLGLEGYAWGFLIGAIATFVLQLGILVRHRQAYSLRIAPFASEVREVVVIAVPLFIGLAGTRLDAFLDFAFASFLPAGHLTVRIFAELLAVQVVDMLLIVSNSVLLPHFAHLVAEGRNEELRERLLQSLAGAFTIAAPAAAFLMVGAGPVVDLLFLRGQFTKEMAELGALLVPFAAAAGPVYLMGQILAQMHISRGDTRTPMIVGFQRIAVKLTLAIALIFPLGILGLVIASTAGSWFRTAMLWWRLPAEHRPPGGEAARRLAATSLAAGVGAAAAWALFRFVPAQPTIWLEALRVLGAAGLLGVLSMGLSLAFGDPILRGLVGRVRSRLRKRR